MTTQEYFEKTQLLIFDLDASRFSLDGIGKESVSAIKRSNLGYIARIEDKYKEIKKEAPKGKNFEEKAFINKQNHTIESLIAKRREDMLQENGLAAAVNAHSR